MPSRSVLHSLFVVVMLALSSSRGAGQVSVPGVVPPRHVELGEPRLDQLLFLLETPLAYPAEVDLARSPLPTALRAFWLTPVLRPQLAFERLAGEGERPDGFGLVAGLTYPIQPVTTAFLGTDITAEVGYSRAPRPDGTYRTQVDGTLGVSKVGVFPAPVEVRFSAGPVLRVRRAPAPGDQAVTFLGGGLAAGLFGTFPQQRLGLQLTAEWLRNGDPYRGSGHHSDWKIALGAHYQYDLIADSD